MEHLADIMTAIMIGSLFLMGATIFIMVMIVTILEIIRQNKQER